MLSAYFSGISGIRVCISVQVLRMIPRSMAGVLPGRLVDCGGIIR